MHVEAPRVLVVDDQPVATYVLAAILRRLGYVSEAVNDSRKALPVAREFKPQVVVLDISMPYLNGYEVARQIRRDENLKNVPIVCVSAYDHEDHKRRAVEAGIDHQLVKPCDFNKLKTLIAKLVE